MYPGNTFDFSLLKKIIDKAYWPIFGELTLLDEIKSNRGQCSATDEISCPSEIGVVYSYSFLILYMVVGNLLNPFIFFN